MLRIYLFCVGTFSNISRSRCIVSSAGSFVTFVKSNALLPLTLRIKGRRSARLMTLCECHSLPLQNPHGRLLIPAKRTVIRYGWRYRIKYFRYRIIGFHLESGYQAPKWVPIFGTAYSPIASAIDIMASDISVSGTCSVSSSYCSL